MSKAGKMIVPEIIYREGISELPGDGWLTKFLLDLAGMLELPGNGKCRMEILFTDDIEIQELNRDYRNKNQATDVLSFSDGETLPETDEVFLGSVVISTERGKAQAAEIGHSFEQELKFLVLHGLLHLLGYDHENDQGQMLQLQLDIKVALPAHFQGKG